MDREKLLEMAASDSSAAFTDGVSRCDASMSSRLEEIVASRFPSVPVSYEAGDRTYLQIRGANSLHPNQEQPFIVVDSIPHYAPPGYSLIGINPQDVARIDALKGPRATGRWGRQGIDGVIVITTKRGGLTKFSIAAYSCWTRHFEPRIRIPEKDLFPTRFGTGCVHQ